jgi:hypothetical protein
MGVFNNFLMGVDYNTFMRYITQEKVCRIWSGNLSYAIGLIASDGCLSKDGRHIYFVSKDLDMVMNLKQALKIDVGVYRTRRGGSLEKKNYSINFGDKVFWGFLNQIGLTPAKSKTIREVVVPEEFFPDFLRGLFDGDGSFYTFWDKRWPSSFVFKLTFASASSNFIYWLKERNTYFFEVNGFVHKGAGVLNLEYTKGDSKRLITAMYHSPEVLFLPRKRDKIESALTYDALLHQKSPR